MMKAFKTTAAAAAGLFLLATLSGAELPRGGSHIAGRAGSAIAEEA